jgi:hypothetical protein
VGSLVCILPRIKKSGCSLEQENSENATAAQPAARAPS